MNNNATATTPGLVLASSALIVVTTLVLSLPMAVAITAVALVPWFGHLGEARFASLWNLVWLYPLSWAWVFAGQGLIQNFYLLKFPITKGGDQITEALSYLMFWLILAFAYRVIFTDDLGTLVAALLSVLAMVPLLRWAAKRQGPARPGSEAPTSGNS